MRDFMPFDHKNKVVWDKPISWSKFSAALACQRKLLYLLTKQPVIAYKDNFYTLAGHYSQLVMEVFVNKGLYKKDKAWDRPVLTEILNRVIKAEPIPSIDYPPGQDEASLLKYTERMLDGMRHLGVTQGWQKKTVASEVEYRGVFRSFRLYAKVDFVEGDKTLSFYDAKGYSQMNADKSQLFIYTISARSQGLPVEKAALFYTLFSKEDQLDVSPEGIRGWLDKDEVRQAFDLFQRLKAGVTLVDVTYDTDHCYMCAFKRACPMSKMLKPAPGSVSGLSVE